MSQSEKIKVHLTHEKAELERSKMKPPSLSPRSRSKLLGFRNHMGYYDTYTPILFISQLLKGVAQF